MKYLLTFSKKQGVRPIIAETVLATGVLINVERAVISPVSGELLISIPDDKEKIITEKLLSYDLTLSRLDNSVQRDEDECVDCGECISICPQDVFYFDDTWSLCMRPEKCVLCGKCVPNCPQRALKLLKP